MKVFKNSQHQKWHICAEGERSLCGKQNLLDTSSHMEYKKTWPPNVCRACEHFQPATPKV